MVSFSEDLCDHDIGKEIEELPIRNLSSFWMDEKVD